MFETRHATQGEATPTPNRADRRRAQLVARGVNSVAARINNAVKVNNETVKTASSEITDFDRNITLIIYRGVPFAHELLSAHRELDEALSIAGEISERQKLEGKVPFVTPEQFATLSKVDFFGKKVNGITLLDIEQMELGRNNELSLYAVKRINRFFHVPFGQTLKAGLVALTQSSKHFIYEDTDTRQYPVFFLIQDLARPEEKITTPANLVPLKRRLMSYFDWYTNAILNFDLDGDNEEMFIKALAWNRPWLPQMLGAYIPARLGITPSSTIKLFEVRGRVAPVPMFSWNRVAVFLKLSAQDAYRVNAFPPDLAEYQFYNSEMDRRAENLLRKYYNSQSEAQITQGSMEGESLFERFLGPYFKTLSEDVYHSSGRRIELKLRELSLPDDFPFHEVVITSQNRQTLVFILRGNEDGTHLTIEFNKDRAKDVFGLPPKIVADYPNMALVFVEDILAPVMAYVEARHPNIKKPSIKETSREEVGTPKEVVEPLYIPQPKEPVKKAPKLRILTPIEQVLKTEGPELPDIHRQPKRQFVVFHSRDGVAEFLGRRPEDILITRIMRKIRDFEYGVTEAKILEEVGGLWEIRSGNYRVVLRHTDGRFFELFAVGHRSRIFSRTGVHPSMV